MATKGKELVELLPARLKDRLSPALSGLVVEDWLGLDLEQVTNLFPLEVRPQVAAFHRHLEREGVFALAIQEQAPAEATDTDMRRTLRLSGLVSSKVFPGHSLEAFVEHGMQQLSYHGVHRVDLSNCDLMNVDMRDVVKLCKNIAERKEVTPFVVDISNNFFDSEALNDVADLCTNDKVTYVFTPELGNLSTAPFLAELPLKHPLFDRLIFIPKWHVSGENWHNVVPVAARDKVRAAHNSFYQL